MASARDMPSMTRSWTCFHFSAATGEEASLQRITRARLSGTPAASKLESKRVKFSSILGDTFLAPPRERFRESEEAFSFGSAEGSLSAFLGGALPLTGFASARRMG